MERLNKFVTNPIVVLASYVLTVIGFLISLSCNFWLQLVATLIMAVNLFVLLICFIRYKLNIKKAKEQIKNELEIITLKNIESAVDCVSTFVEFNIDNSLYLKNDDVTDDYFQSVCRNVCQHVGTVLSKICGIDFSVCLKKICVDELIDFDYCSACTQTIARSGKQAAERSKDDHMKQKISENTSFLRVLQKNYRCWASPNLEITENRYNQIGESYLNPDKNYRKYYKSTIVVPIRIKAKRVSQVIVDYSDSKKPEGYHYMAFLCVDSPKRFTEDDTDFLLASTILSTIGDALYPLFENKLVREINKV